MGTAKDRASVPFALGERNIPESLGQMVNPSISALTGKGRSLRAETQTSKATISFDKVQFLNLSHYSIDQAFIWDKSAKKKKTKQTNKQQKENKTKKPSTVLTYMALA